LGFSRARRLIFGQMATADTSPSAAIPAQLQVGGPAPNVHRLFVELGQLLPGQQRCVLPPHGTQLPAPVHTKPVWQKSPPTWPGQQRWPLPPHARQFRLPPQSEYASEQNPPGQQAWPILPHVPPMQPPLVQVPAPPGQALAAATQVRWPPPASTQQPPLAQTFPSQQICPVPPHAAHAGAAPADGRGSQAVPALVQKSAASPLSPPGQQACVARPQVTVAAPPMIEQLPAVHVEVSVAPPVEKPHDDVEVAQNPPTQQPGVATVPHVSFAQQGCFSPPQACIAPFTHTPPLKAWPEATQFPLEVSQQPPPPHMLPGQHI
jgi:hypothetical protein